MDSFKRVLNRWITFLKRLISDICLSYFNPFDTLISLFDIHEYLMQSFIVNLTISIISLLVKSWSIVDLFFLDPHRYSVPYIFCSSLHIDIWKHGDVLTSLFSTFYAICCHFFEIFNLSNFPKILAIPFVVVLSTITSVS